MDCMFGLCSPIQAVECVTMDGIHLFYGLYSDFYFSSIEDIYRRKKKNRHLSDSIILGRKVVELEKRSITNGI